MINEISIGFIAALFGAGFQELIYWRSLSRTLAHKTFKAMYKRKDYWIITVVTILASAVGVMLWAHETTGYRLKDYAIMGAAFPALFKVGVHSFKRDNGPKLGTNAPSFSNTLRNYFFPERLS